MSQIPWSTIITAAIGIVIGLVGPSAAAGLRALSKRGQRDAKATPSKDDDRRWEIIGPILDRAADALDRGDHAEAERLAKQIVTEATKNR